MSRRRPSPARHDAHDAAAGALAAGLPSHRPRACLLCPARAELWRGAVVDAEPIRFGLCAGHDRRFEAGDADVVGEVDRLARVLATSRRAA